MCIRRKKKMKCCEETIFALQSDYFFIRRLDERSHVFLCRERPHADEPTSLCVLKFAKWDDCDRHNGEQKTHVTTTVAAKESEKSEKSDDLDTTALGLESES